MTVPPAKVLSGILLLDKPAGCSSNSALQRVRRLLGGAKAGHVGSLDPLATGMLPICIGEATKVAGEILSGLKCYRFTVRLGERTATGDAEGEIVERAPVPALEPAAIRAELGRRCGTQLQVPPMYSAIKQGGQPLYRLARAGREIERAARTIEITRYELLRCAPPELELEVLCSKGTYVRVLAEDLAVALGTCGHVVQLRRVYVEPFRHEPMQDFAQLESACAAGAPALLPVDFPLAHLPAVHLDAAQSARLRHGQPVQTTMLPAPQVRLYGPEGLLGLGSVDPSGRAQPRRLLRN